MKVRVDAATDVAMIGAWDGGRATEAFTAAEAANQSASLENDALQGHLFLIHTDADVGGPVDVYVDETAPLAVRARIKPIAENARLSLPSGSLVVGGVEDYRSTHETSLASVINVPPGDYAVRCFVPTNTEQEPASEASLREVVAAADIAYYDRINSRGCAGGALTLLLFPALAIVIDWRLALALTVVVFLSFFPIREWALKRNARYQRLNAIIPLHRLGHEDAMFVLELRRVDSPAGLRGMSVASSGLPT